MAKAVTHPACPLEGESETGNFSSGISVLCEYSIGSFDTMYPSDGVVTTLRLVSALCEQLWW